MSLDRETSIKPREHTKSVLKNPHKNKQRQVNQEEIKGYSNYKNVKKSSSNKIIIACVAAAAIFGGTLLSNYIKDKNISGNINKRVESLDLSASKTKALENELTDAYKAFHAQSGSYTNADQASIYFEKEITDVAKNQATTAPDIVVAADELRKALWDTAKEKGGENPNQAKKQCDPEAAEKLLNAKKIANKSK